MATQTTGRLSRFTDSQTVRGASDSQQVKYNHSFYQNTQHHICDTSEKLFMRDSLSDSIIHLILTELECDFTYQCEIKDKPIWKQTTTPLVTNHWRVKKTKKKKQNTECIPPILFYLLLGASVQCDNLPHKFILQWLSQAICMYCMVAPDRRWIHIRLYSHVKWKTIERSQLKHLTPSRKLLTANCIMSNDF